MLGSKYVFRFMLVLLTMLKSKLILIFMLQLMGNFLSIKGKFLSR